MSRHRRKPEEVEEFIIKMLGKHPQGMSIAAIAGRLGLSNSGVAKYLKEMRADGKLTRGAYVSYGRARIAYKLAKPTESTNTKE